MSTRSIQAPQASEQQVVVIPTTAKLLGPQFSRLPRELLREIFRHLVITMFPPESRLHKVLDVRTFGIVNRFVRIDNVRRVNSIFRDSFMEAFYENFHFSLEYPSPTTGLPGPAPRVDLRHHLRSLHAVIVLYDQYMLDPVPGKQGRVKARFTDAATMKAVCPSTRFLLRLTSADGGFPNLHFLDLHIRTRFKHPFDKQFLGVLDDVNFTVAARKVKLTVTDYHVEFVWDYHKEVEKRIVVVQD